MNPHLVVLDGYALNPGDLSWEELKALGECEIHDRSTPDAVLSRSRDAEIIITNKVVLNRDLINRLPKLNYIGVTATGAYIVLYRRFAVRESLAPTVRTSAVEEPASAG